MSRVLQNYKYWSLFCQIVLEYKEINEQIDVFSIYISQVYVYDVVLQINILHQLLWSNSKFTNWSIAQ
jgi:hypothetical protein